MTLFLHNSLTRQKEEFNPIDSTNVRLYVCGPTVYDRAHLGNGRPVVVFDVLYRLLQHLYPRVTYVRNITDVDDKINAAAKAKGISIGELTKETTAFYHEDMAALGALSPDHEPRATDHIPQMIDIIQQLITKDFAYAADNHVLFRVNRFPEYGALSNRNQDELLAGARVEVAPYKENSGDFVLWKPSPDDLPGWDSPWGRGRPGWHIECSAMSAHFLGQQFDIHGGGIDLLFPHHENELAQSCCAHDTQIMANYWVHNGHLTVNDEKMSKSLGNFFTVKDLLNKYDGETIRFAMLMTHYRQPLDWNEDLLTQAKQSLDRFYIALHSAQNTNKKEALSTDVLNALLDDLNTPLAISHLHQITTDLNKATTLKEKVKLASALKESAKLLGILQKDPQQWLQGESNTSIAIEELIAARVQAKIDKDFTKADKIRNDLLSQGIILEDNPNGTTWRRA